MKIKLIFCAVISLMLSILANAVGAATIENAKTAYNWYCNKSKNGEQPALPSEFGFIKKSDGYYIDEKASINDDKVIYLTFDCGYENGNVERILYILKKHDAKGAFFVLGNLVKRNTELVKRMYDEGHLVCNHTCSHKNMTRMSCKEDFSKELQGFVEKLMAKITTDMQNKKPVNQSEFYTLTNLLKYLPNLVKLELKEQTQIPKPIGQLSEDFIKQIEKEFFGLG